MYCKIYIYFLENSLNIIPFYTGFLLTVYSKDIKWVPIGRQTEMFPNGAEELCVLENDILIAKMRPGHEIHAFMHACKGISRDHAKYSPVCT